MNITKAIEIRDAAFSVYHPQTGYAWQLALDAARRAPGDAQRERPARLLGQLVAELAAVGLSPSGVLLAADMLIEHGRATGVDMTMPAR